VLLLTIDTVRADRVGTYGDHLARTPAIDRLAREGLLFARATSQVPLTLPSHCSILTGTYPPYHGVRKNGGFALDNAFDTLAEVLAASGYRAGAFVSSFSLNHIYGIGQGFEIFDDVSATKEFLVEGPAAGTRRLLYPERPANETIDRAIAWLGRPSKKPDFVWVHLFDPHDPYEPAAPYETLFATDPYRGEIAAMDREIARLLAAMAERGPHVVALVADHGEGLGDHGEKTHGYLLYEETLRVPLVIWSSDGARGVRSDLAETVDLVPTILGLAGVPWSGTLQGRDLRSDGAALAVDSLAYAETLYGKLSFDWSDLRAMRSGDWKYISGPDPELYDLAGDPAETRNLRLVESAVSARLREAVRAVLETKPDLPESAGVVAIGREEAEALAALGYVGGAHGSGKRSGLDDEIGIGLNPKDGLPWTYAADAVQNLLKGGHADSAIAIALEIAKAGMAPISSKVAAMSSLILWERFATARDVGVEALRHAPDSHDVLIDLAAAHLALHDAAASRAAAERAIALQPDSHLALYGLARVLAYEAKPDSAIRALRESLRIEAKQLPALLLLTRLLYDKRHIEEAYETIREASRLEPDNKTVRELQYRIEMEFPDVRSAR
jgi:arylsulfatase A-like enzyme